mmetsp:Transcript_92797/g.266843  ORF Transcript_92797/g.266843 Transcript_92797/m.266843 type:complete len:304 (+) Transcript_92797:1652-2563(+)
MRLESRRGKLLLNPFLVFMACQLGLQLRFGLALGGDFPFGLLCRHLSASGIPFASPSLDLPVSFCVQQLLFGTLLLVLEDFLVEVLLPLLVFAPALLRLQPPPLLLFLPSPDGFLSPFLRRLLPERMALAFFYKAAQLDHVGAINLALVILGGLAVAAWASCVLAAGTSVVSVAGRSVAGAAPFTCRRLRGGLPWREPCIRGLLPVVVDDRSTFDLNEPFPWDDLKDAEVEHQANGGMPMLSLGPSGRMRLLADGAERECAALAVGQTEERNDKPAQSQAFGAAAVVRGARATRRWWMNLIFL